MILENDKFTIREVKQLHKEILEFLEKNPVIEIDFKNIDEIDMSGIQLLISMKSYCEKENKEFKIIHIKDDLLYSFELTGTNSILGL